MFHFPTQSVSMQALIVVSVTLATVALSGCGGASTSSPAGSAFATAQVSQAAEPAPVRVCHNYVIQRAVVLANATPALTEASKFAAWLSIDAAQAGGSTKTGRDFAEFSRIVNTDLQTLGTGRPALSDAAISKQVYLDCEALGVSFSG